MVQKTMTLNNSLKPIHMSLSQHILQTKKTGKNIKIRMENGKRKTLMITKTKMIGTKIRTEKIPRMTPRKMERTVKRTNILTGKKMTSWILKRMNRMVLLSQEVGCMELKSKTNKSNKSLHLMNASMTLTVLVTWLIPSTSHSNLIMLVRH